MKTPSLPFPPVTLSESPLSYNSHEKTTWGYSSNLWPMKMYELILVNSLALVVVVPKTMFMGEKIFLLS